MREWLHDAADRIAERTGDQRDLYDIADGDVDRLLALAGAAAHMSGDRTNAPLATFLTGVALGRHPELNVEELARIAGGEGAA